MAEIDLIKISELPETSTIGDADELAVAQGGATKKVPYSVLKAGAEVTPDTTLSEAGVPADAAAVGAALALKANQAAVTQALAAKADKSEVTDISGDIAELASVVETKADQTALNQKADKTTTDALRQDLTTLNGIVNQKADKTELNTQIGNVTAELATKANTADVNNLLAAKANVASPVFTGRPQAPTAPKGTATLQLATTAFVQNAIDDKQDTLTFDSTPTEGSTNPVTSGGVWEAIQTDKTLAVEDKAADAKTTGNRIAELKNDLDENVSDLKSAVSYDFDVLRNQSGVTVNYDYAIGNRLRSGFYSSNDGTYNPSRTDYWCIENLIPVKPNDILSLSLTEGENGYVYFAYFNAESTFISTSSATTVTVGATSNITIPQDCYYVGISYMKTYMVTIDPDDYKITVHVNYNSETTDGSINFLHNEINLINNIENADYVDGYSASNSSSVNLSVSPFVYDSVEITQTFIVKSLRLNCNISGVISLGVIKKSDFTNPPNMAKVNYKTTVSISIGVLDYSIGNPFKIEPDEYLVVGKSTDTGKWAYGTNGTDKGFSYNNTTTWVHSTNSVGITVNGESYQSYIINSIYKGKSLSILGDSISTYNGYIPEGNLTYYPSGTVQAVTDTWWKKLIDALGMELSVNNSWSGSRVTTTAGDTSAGCMTRCESLGTSPDVIIVWMGINDFNNEVALGTYDGTTAIPETTTTFREAYGIMLNKILTAYKTSEVWVCTLPQCERNGESGFPEINGNGVALAEFNKAIKELADAFGVKILDHNKCGLTYQNMPTYNPDNLHPNKYGHSLIANNDIWQMDGSVRKRYTLS